MLLVFTLMLADFFDTMGTVVGVGQEAGLLDEEGRLPGVDRVLLVDSVAADGRRCGVGVVGHHLHRVGGRRRRRRPHRAGERRHRRAVPRRAARHAARDDRAVRGGVSPALVIVGFLLLTQIRNIDFDDYAIAIPAFLTIVLMPFTYSITNGIGAGFVSYAVLKATQGRAREVSPAAVGHRGAVRRLLRDRPDRGGAHRLSSPPLRGGMR